jgi:peptide/nickel transport system permease protein
VRLGLVLVGAMFLAALLAPWITSYDPLSIDAGAMALAPSTRHWLGTDGLGRDLFTRVLYGARVSLVLAVLAALVSLTIGTAVGSIAGYVGGRTDDVLMRIVDAGIALPRVFFVLIPLALWEQASWTMLVPILGATVWFPLSRVVRAEVRSLKARAFVGAAEGLGLSGVDVVRRHILPHLAGPIAVAATLTVGQIMLLEAGLSYLGLGVPAQWPSWGKIIFDGQPYLLTAPWIALLPGLALVTAVLAFSILGDGLERTFQPERA